MKEISEQLAAPMPYKWRVQAVNKQSLKASCVAYVDARDVMERLDDVVGPENWQKDYKEIKGNLFAGIGIRHSDEWIWKWDCGTESQTEKEKGEASDSFKRAAVNWKVGRFLYDLPVKYVKMDPTAKFPVDESGQRIWDLTKHFNGDQQKQAPANKKQVQEQQQKQPVRNLQNDAPPPAPTEPASVKQKTELLLLVNNKAITKEEKEKMLNSINSLDSERIETSIAKIKKVIADRTKEENAAA